MSRQYDPYENVVAVMEEAMNIGMSSAWEILPFIFWPL